MRFPPFRPGATRSSGSSTTRPPMRWPPRSCSRCSTTRPRTRSRDATQPWVADREPQALELLIRAQLNNLRQPLRLARLVTEAVPALRALIDRRRIRASRSLRGRAGSAHALQRPHHGAAPGGGGADLRPEPDQGDQAARRREHRERRRDRDRGRRTSRLSRPAPRAARDLARGDDADLRARLRARPRLAQPDLRPAHRRAHGPGRSGRAPDGDPRRDARVEVDREGGRRGPAHRSGQSGDALRAHGSRRAARLAPRCDQPAALVLQHRGDQRARSADPVLLCRRAPREHGGPAAGGGGDGAHARDRQLLRHAHDRGRRAARDAAGAGALRRLPPAVVRGAAREGVRHAARRGAGGAARLQALGARR